MLIESNRNQKILIAHGNHDFRTCWDLLTRTASKSGRLIVPIGTGVRRFDSRPPQDATQTADRSPHFAMVLGAIRSVKVTTPGTMQPLKVGHLTTLDDSPKMTKMPPRSVVMFSPHALIQPHFETELGIGREHLLAGDDVIWIGCNRRLQQCDFNQPKLASNCCRCAGRQHEGLRRLATTDGPGKLIVKSMPVPTTAQRHMLRRKLPTTMTSQDQLKHFRFEDFDVGLAVLSTFVSHTRDVNFDVAEHSDRVTATLRSAVETYVSMRKFLNELDQRPTRLYAFNGRYAILRAAYRAAGEAGVDTILHDRGGRKDTVEFYENHMAHDLAYVHKLTHDAWKRAEPSNRRSIGESFFEDRAVGSDKSWVSFTADQDRSRLPGTFDRDRKNVVVFNSSEDEFVAIGPQAASKVYDDQLSALIKLKSDLADGGRGDVDVHVRCHPNLGDVNPETVQSLMDLDSPSFRIIAPKDSVDSYALLRAADLVMTFGSTMGVEANYWGKPSILAGPSFYEFLDVTYNLESHQQLLDWIADIPPAKSRDGAIRYGYYWKTFGRTVPGFSADGFFSARFDGEPIEPQGWERKRLKLHRRIEKYRRAA